MPELMENFGWQLRDLLLNEYEDVFECFYSTSKDSHIGKQYFMSQELPVICPLVYILDKQDRVKRLKKNLLGLLELSEENNNFYYRKYSPDFIFFGD